MTASSVLKPHPPEFERFLYASVGHDRKGRTVTVLSALARLDLDPWKETADLVALGRDAAATRLGLLLAKFRDVPALASNPGPVVQHLSLLLPAPPQHQALATAASSAANSLPQSTALIWTILAFLFVLLQFLFTGTLGVGE